MYPRVMFLGEGSSYCKEKVSYDMGHTWVQEGDGGE